MKLQNNTINYCEFHHNDNEASFARDVLNGLSGERKSLPCKYIYDDTGSSLFQQIMNLPEYYPTDCEKEILQTYGNDISAYFKKISVAVVELGAGDGAKTELLLASMLENNIDLHYIPIDISETAIQGLVHRLTESHADLYISGLVTEYFHGLKYLSKIGKRSKLVLFLGSNIGNMPYSESIDFLTSLRESLSKEDYLLIGFDLEKDFTVLNRAYNDSEGITEAFNKNILERINRELDGDFDPALFSYHSSYDPDCYAVRSYLVSMKAQRVTLKSLDISIYFDKHEAIHTESSYKYTEEIVSQFATESGFSIIQNFHDKRNYFLDSLWKVV